MYVYFFVYLFHYCAKSNSEQACIISERIQTNAYSAQLTCTLILNADWSEKVFLSNF